MTPLAFGFLVASWAGVLGLTGWSFYRVLRVEQRRGSHEASNAGPDDGEAA